MLEFQWYQVIERTQSLEQGDLINDFPIIYPVIADKKLDETSAHLDTSNVIIMTQSCDFQKLNDDDPIILCPRFNLEDSETVAGKKLNNKEGWSNLRKGNYVHLYLLNKCDLQSNVFPYQVVDLRRVFSTPYSFVKKFVESENSRVRLLPPYREHLAQAFARQFMRIGLPIDLPEKYPLE